MPSIIYTISLNSSIDYTFYLNDIVFEDVNRIEKIRIDPGGKGMNVTRMLNKLGEKSISITFLGKNNGKFYKKLLEKEKIKFIPIEISGELRNIYNFISGNKILRFNEKGPKIKRNELKKLWNIIKNLNFKNDDFIVMSGSIPPGIKKNIYAEIIKKVRKFGVYTIVDADSDTLKETIKERPFLIKPNKNEIERCINERIENFEKLKNICNSLINSGIKIILLTMGKDGAILFSKEKIIYARPPEINFKSSIGCGDAFLAGFLYKFKRGYNLSDCLKFAVATGSAKAEEEGTKMPSLSKVKKILPYVKVNQNIESFVLR